MNTIQLPAMLCAAILTTGLLVSGQAMAQGHQQGNHTWPDTLNLITVTGTVEIDTTPAHPLYFIDVDDDGTADYHLSFGPWWYEPTTGATRPDDGQTVTITGAPQESDELPMTTILVFELDGLVWRVPVEYGLFGYNQEPVWDASGTDPVTVTGTVLVDTTYFYDHYYLDEDVDGLPEYKVGFGPPWYEPASGAVRPEEGQTVIIVGRVHELDGIDLLTVLELDGLAWRPLNEPAPWAGGWLQKGHQATVRAHSVNNPAHWIDFAPGHMGHGNNPWPDSLFIEFWEIHPDSLPGPHQERRFIGFYLDVHDPVGQRMMNGQHGGHQGRLRFEAEHRVRFRYYEADLAARNLMEDGIGIEAWDEAAQEWVALSEISVDPQEQTVSFASSDLYAYYALTAPSISTAIDPVEGVPSNVVLYQNYPNPFNPQTTIPYTVPTTGRVVLSVYDLLGREVATLVDGIQPVGRHTALFDAHTLPSGVYFYRLQAGSTVLARYLILTK